MSEPKTPNGTVTIPGWSWRELIIAEDWWAIWIGAALLIASLAVTGLSPAKDGAPTNSLAPYTVHPEGWETNPFDSLKDTKKGHPLATLPLVLVVSLVVFSAATLAMGTSARSFTIAFLGVFFLTVIAMIQSGQEVVKHYNLEYVLWALFVGLVISNTMGAPAFLRPAMRTELYIKTGLVLLGAEVLLSQLVALGAPGIFIAWVCTPIVLISTYQFGQRVLKMESRSLNLVVSADMSVCGVSAAIATAASCKATKEELSLAIGLSLAFTAIMMVIMPFAIEWMGLGQVIGGAWIGGTIDSTGAVAAAGGILGPAALKTATTIKMIQNILIGVVAFAVAVYWVVYVEPKDSGVRPSAWEIWYRFPKFVLGFIGASIAFSALFSLLSHGPDVVKAATSATKNLRGWFFGFAFVSIGLETDFRQLSHHLKGGKPLILYVVGQSFNLALTLAMAYVMFTYVFPNAAAELVGTP
jgi:uncharacterized integral membrane protein (TIGR00698 family)